MTRPAGGQGVDCRVLVLGGAGYVREFQPFGYHMEDANPCDSRQGVYYIRAHEYPQR
ncbi:MAG: hypothetical protein JWL81_1048 [Verrucomicrobiales bacterium]|nr:hypothetical protein [Verrucomicrobiales bacterium]